MKILYIDHYAGGDKLGMEFRPYYFAKEWAELGHEVTILAADFSHLRKINPTVHKDFEEQIIDGVRFVFVRTNSYQGNGIGRVRNIMTFVHKVSCKSKMLAEKYQPDAVIASSTYPLDIKPAQKIARYAGAKLCFEIHDLWPMSPMVMGNLSEKNPLIMFLQRYEDRAFRESDVIVSILPQADRHIAERGFDTSKFVYIPNGVIFERNDAAVSSLPESYRTQLEQWQQAGRFIVMYAGGHALSNVLDTFITCGKEVDQKAVLVLVGAGAQKENLKALAERLHTDNVYFWDPVPKNAVPELLSYADCLYIGAKKSPLYQYGVGMNKLYDYMQAAKPILYAVDSSNRPVEEAGAGITVEPENTQALAEAIRTVMQMPQAQREEMGQRGRQYVREHHDYQKLAKQFLQALSR